VGQQELDPAAVARVRQRPAGRARGGDAIDDRQHVVVEGDHPVGLELAERDLQPGALSGHLVDAVELEVDEFADPQAGLADQQQGVGGQRLCLGLQRRGEAAVRDAMAATSGHQSFPSLVHELTLAVGMGQEDGAGAMRGRATTPSRVDAAYKDLRCVGSRRRLPRTAVGRRS
jgi:hypothetical protein